MKEDIFVVSNVTTFKENQKEWSVALYVQLSSVKRLAKKGINAIPKSRTSLSGSDASRVQDC